MDKRPRDPLKTETAEEEEEVDHHLHQAQALPSNGITNITGHHGLGLAPVLVLVIRTGTKARKSTSEDLDPGLDLQKGKGRVKVKDDLDPGIEIPAASTTVINTETKTEEEIADS